MTSFLKKIKKHVFVVSVFTLLFVVTAPKTSFAADSGPGTWDFLLFANMNAGGKFAGNSIVGTTQQVSPLAQPGYGAGLGIEYWMSDSWALRFMAQGDVWANNLSNWKNGPFEGIVPVTLGPTIKIFGSENYFAYVPVDLGYALTVESGPLSGQTPGLTQGGSFYFDTGIGVNVRFLFAEVKAAYLMSPGFYSAGSWYYPLTIGFNF